MPLILPPRLQVAPAQAAQIYLRGDTFSLHTATDIHTLVLTVEGADDAITFLLPTAEPISFSRSQARGWLRAIQSTRMSRIGVTPGQREILRDLVFVYYAASAEYDREPRAQILARALILILKKAAWTHAPKTSFEGHLRELASLWHGVYPPEIFQWENLPSVDFDAEHWEDDLRFLADGRREAFSSPNGPWVRIAASLQALMPGRSSESAERAESDTWSPGPASNDDDDAEDYYDMPELEEMTE